jgi:excisionase family DNA binding protein
VSDGAYRTELTAGTAARILGLSVHEVEMLCEAGKLRARRIGERGWWRIDLESLRELMKQMHATFEEKKC